MRQSTRGHEMEEHRVRATLRRTLWFEMTGEAWLSVEDLRLKSFVPYVYTQEQKDFVDSYLNKEVEVIFSFMDLSLDRTTQEVRKIVEVPVERAPNRYEISGRVIDKFPAETEDWESIVVDCGIPIRVSARPGRFKIGDWVRAEGRVDVDFPAQSGSSLERHIQADLH